MTSPQLTAALLLVGGGAVVTLRSQPRRVDIRRRLSVVDGIPRPSRVVVLRALLAILAMLAIPLVPVLAVLAGLPPVAAVLAGLVVLPAVVTIVSELHAGFRRSAMPWRVPLAAEWQRRLAGALVARATAPFPAPPLRRRRPRQRSNPPTLTSAGTGRRLLIVPRGSAEMRLWDVAERYLGARSRYRDIVSLNRGRRSPGGALISEDSLIGPGWTLLVPRDAIGEGLIDLTGDPRTPMPGPAAVPVGDAGTGDPAVETDRAADGDIAAAEVGAAAAVDSTVDAAADGPGESTAPPEYPPAHLPWDLVHSRLLADGVRTSLVLHRSQRDHYRAPHVAVRPLDAAAAAVDIAAELGADRAGALCLDRAVRLLPSPPPPVVASRLLPEVVEFLLATPDPRPPAPFTPDATGARWSVRRGDCVDTGAGAAALPGLVSVGPDQAGWVLIDLLAARGIVALDGETAAARMVATALALELAMKRWSGQLRVVMVGFDHPFGELHPRLVVADRLDEVLDDVIGRAGDDSVDTPDFLVLAQPPSRVEYDVLRRLTGGARSTLGVLVVGRGHGDRWVWALGPDGVLTCPEIGVAVGAQALSSDTAAALARLVHAESGSDPAGQQTVRPRSVDPDGVEVVVRLFGELALDGPDGVLEADSLTVEIIAFLALRGAVEQAEIAAAVFPFGVSEADLRAELAAVVDVLATAPSGHPGLLEHDDGRLELTQDVQTDWHLFVAFGRAGRSADALGLLSRAAPGGRSPGPDGAWFSWLGSEPLARAVPGIVADAAHDLVEQHLSADRPDLAAVAAGAGLRAQPLSQVLRDDLQRSLQAMQIEAKQIELLQAGSLRAGLLGDPVGRS